MINPIRLLLPRDPHEARCDAVGHDEETIYKHITVSFDDKWESWRVHREIKYHCKRCGNVSYFRAKSPAPWTESRFKKICRGYTLIDVPDVFLDSLWSE